MSMIHAVHAEKNFLYGWEGHRVHDIRARMFKYSYSKLFSGNVLEGKLANANGEPILAFKRMENGWAGQGNIAICSTEHEYFLVYNKTKVAFYYNRKPLGEWFSNGVLLNPEGREIGRCNQGNNVTITIGKISFDTDDLKFQCSLNGRVVATIYRSPRFDERFSDTWLRFNQNNGTKMIDLHTTITIDEERVLTCVILTEMLRNGFSFSRISNNGMNVFNNLRS